MRKSFIKKIARTIVSTWKENIVPLSKWLCVNIAKKFHKSIKFFFKLFKKLSKFVHHHIAKRPHNYLRSKYRWYDRWHTWNYHPHVHYTILSIYLVIIGAMVLVSYGKVHAASDLSNTWDFVSASGYSIDSGLETNGTSARMKAQNYTTDANTMGLFHFDETVGTTASDSSANGNNLTSTGTASWIAGNLNNSISLSGTNASLSAPDSVSLSLTQDNSLEGWTKFSSTFGAGTHDHKQGVIDKGSYQLYYDQETGKVTYELANNSATNWTQQAGNDVKNSWDLNGKFSVNSQVAVGSDIYVGLGNAVGDAEVWKWNGTTWTQVGGDGKNSSWADLTYENVTSMAVNVLPFTLDYQ